LTQYYLIDQDYIANQEHIATLNILVFPNNSGKLDKQSELLLPLVLIIKKPEDDLSDLDNQKLDKAISEQPISFSQ
jgi:hypothetical protein